MSYFDSNQHLSAQSVVFARAQTSHTLICDIGAICGSSIKDLTETIARLCGFHGRIVWDTTKPNGQPRRKLDTNRAKATFGFEATTPFEDGLKNTIAWYKCFGAGEA